VMQPSRTTRGSSERSARPEAADTSPGTGPTKKTKSQSGLLALQAFWHPDTPNHSKAKWATLYGVSRQLMRFHENKEGMRLVEARFRAGKEPPPPLPTGHETPEAQPMSSGDGVVVHTAVHTAVQTPEAAPTSETLHGVHIATLRIDLESRCTRAGDSAKYGQKGLVGMYREGIKWAELQLAKEQLSSRQAAAVLKAVGVSVGFDSLNNKKLRADGGKDAVLLKACKSRRPSRLRDRVGRRLRKRCLHFLSLRLSSNLNAGGHARVRTSSLACRIPKFTIVLAVLYRK
jgi:hypothetical protein